MSCFVGDLLRATIGRTRKRQVKSEDDDFILWPAMPPLAEQLITTYDIEDGPDWHEGLNKYHGECAFLDKAIHPMVAQTLSQGSALLQIVMAIAFPSVSVNI